MEEQQVVKVEVHDVEEGEISDSASVEEITEEAFSTKASPPPVPPLKSIVNSNNINDNNNTGGGSGARVWTMRDLYKYQISSKTSYSGLYNLAWAQAVNNKPLGDVFVMMEDGTKANNGDGTNGNEDKMVIDVEDEGEKEEGELEEGEIDLDSDLVLVNKDSNASEVVKSVDLIKEELENLNVAIIAHKPYDKLCSSLESTAVSLQKMILGGLFPEKDTLVQLLLAAIQTLYSAFSSMTLTLKEQNKSVLLRLVAQVTSMKPLLFSPLQLKEVEAMRSSLVSCADSLSNVNNHHEADLNVSLDQTQHSSSLQYSKPPSAGAVSSSRHKGAMVSLPLLDLHKDHDADSLPSPTRDLSATNIHLPFEHGLVKPEWPIPRSENQNPARMLHPYEKDAVKAVSSYQQKFTQRSFFMSDNLPSPTPSEDGDTTTGVDGDISGEVSSSIIQKVNSPAAVKNTLISLQPMVSSSYTEMSNSRSAGFKSSSAKSRDPRLRLANLDSRSQSLPDESKLESLGMMSSRKHEAAEEQVSDGPALKRQRNGFSAPNATLPLVSTTIPTTISSLTTLSLTSQSEMLPVKNANTTSSSLHSLLRDIAVNPSVWMDILKMEHLKPADDIKSTTQMPNSNTFLGTVPSTIGVPPFSMHGHISSSSSSSSGAGIIQTPSKAVSAEEPGKIRMKPRDPRRILHNSSSQKGVTAAPDPSKINTKTLSTPWHEDQLEKKSVSSSSSVKPPDIAKQFTSNLRNIADMMSVSQECMPSSALPQILLQPVQVYQVAPETKGAVVAADSGNNPPEAAIAAPPRPMNAIAWNDVEHLFEGFDEQQKAAIQRERAKRLDEQKKMFAERKLCLVLDLDHTLLNSAKFVEVDSLHDEMLRKKEEQDREKPQRHLFRFPHMAMWTKLRPGIWNFLEKASKLFEMHLYTMGNKYYATEMAKLLDPRGELFSGRVISRGDDGEPFDSDDRVPKSKDLEGVLGMESAVVIVDDSVRVWPHNKLNLIAVERYIYFPCSRRQFGLPGPSLLEIDHDERPEDGTLASSLAVIERIHENFFGHQSLDEADVRSILALEQQKILAGCRVVFSRVFPVGEANPHMHPLWQTAEQFGAVCVNQIDEQVTHVVANSLGTDKVNWALSTGRFVVHPGCSDVYSYDEDASVVDPLLAQHLQHFGIDFSSMQKTEMTTAERELDHNTSFDWNRIQESGEEVEPLFGPGYTGLINLGNSCYLAATMQVVFSTRGFCSRYYLDQSLKVAFDTAPADPTVDLNSQLTKLAHGLLSGKYSIPATKKDDAGDAAQATLTTKQEGIPPRMFKSVIAAKHPEFSTMRQQDALEFFLYFIDQVERVNTGNPILDPSRSFKFGIEERLQCSSGKVAYNKRSDYILSLNIPVHKATNKIELEEFQKLKAEKDAKGEELNSKEIVRPRVPLMDCLNCFSAPEDLHDFYSTALNAKTTAVKTAGLTSFPDYLVLHMRKFVLEEGWVPKKLDVYIDAPDTIDISNMRSKGLQPWEELLPESAAAEDADTSANEDIVQQLVSMGFQYNPCRKAAINTSNAGLEEAMNWLLNHMNDPDIDEPITKAQKSAPFIDPSKVETLISFGFEEEVARKALQASDGDIEKATEWIFNPPSGVTSMDATTSSSGNLADANLPDGQGRYRLIGLVSHIGTSTHCGHYVAHIYKDGRWVIFNDDKVALSKNPPTDMAYLYFYERIDG